jgi:hypothetical protein
MKPYSLAWEMTFLENVGVTHGAKIGIPIDLPIKFQGDSLGAITLPSAFGPSFVNLFPRDWNEFATKVLYLS